jgi:hypothetical protein
MLFVPGVYPPGTNEPPTPLLRAQWLSDGRQSLVSWVFEEDGDRLDLAVLPLSGESAVRLFTIEAKEPGQMLMLPIAVVGQEVLLRGDKTLLKLNLATGAKVSHDLDAAEDELFVYPGLDGESAFYLVQLNEPKQYVFGRLNPKTLARSPLITFTNNVADGSFFAYNQKGDRLAFVEKTGDGQQLVVLQAGKPVLTRTISETEELRCGNAVLLERKDLIVVSYMREHEGTNRASFGLLEMPLKEGPIRDTVLIRDTEAKDNFAPFLFQVGVSHDAKTAAVSSMYLACMGDEFRAEDCALFFVDLSDAKRKVTRIPIAMPAKRPGPLAK